MNFRVFTVKLVGVKELGTLGYGQPVGREFNFSAIFFFGGGFELHVHVPNNKICEKISV